MDFFNIQLVILIFGIGLLLGSVVSYFVMRRVLQKNIKALSQHFKLLNSQNLSSQREPDPRREDLLLLADKLKQIESNIQKIRQKDFNTYISRLNRLLDRTGITQIDNKN